LEDPDIKGVAHVEALNATAEDRRHPKKAQTFQQLGTWKM
jgi:hypothetical protein